MSRLDSFYFRKDLVFKTSKAHLRKESEKLSVAKLLEQADYLSKYNLAIRYVFLHLLKKGYDIHNTKVHKAFYAYCVGELCCSSEMIAEIVQTRHRFKYSAIPPNLITEKQLDDLIKLLRNNLS